MEDHSSLEPIEFNDNGYLTQILAEENDKIVDQFAEFTVLAHKECKIYAKNATYCVIRFGHEFKDMALAVPHVVHYDLPKHNGLAQLTSIEWGAKGYFNCKRIDSDDEFNGVKWLATLLWTNCRKPHGSSYISDDAWNVLLEKYNELGFDLDTSIHQKPDHITIRSIANELSLPETGDYLDDYHK